MFGKVRGFIPLWLELTKYGERNLVNYRLHVHGRTLRLSRQVKWCERITVFHLWTIWLCCAHTCPRRPGGGGVAFPPSGSGSHASVLAAVRLGGAAAACSRAIAGDHIIWRPLGDA